MYFKERKETQQLASVRQLLNELAELRARIEESEAPLRKKIHERTLHLRTEAETIEEMIREKALALGRTIHGESLMAIPMTRVRWDTKGLIGYAQARPEVLKFKKTSRSVQIRRITDRADADSEVEAP